MRVKIAIVEDEQTHRKLLEQYLEAWSRQRQQSIEVLAFSSAESFLFAWEEAKDFDILFADIQMDGMDGMEMARKVRTQDEDVAIVFTTGIGDYVETGYEVEALHYLRKPLREEKIAQCMDKALQRGRREQFVVVHGREELYKLPVRRITYVEAQGHGCVVETFSREGETTRTEITESISEMAQLLGEEDFVKCHRSYLCRIESVHQIGRTEIIFDNGSRIPVSRRMYVRINQIFIDHFRRLSDSGIQ